LQVATNENLDRGLLKPNGLFVTFKTLLFYLTWSSFLPFFLPFPASTLVAEMEVDKTESKNFPLSSSCLPFLLFYLYLLSSLILSTKIDFFQSFPSFLSLTAMKIE
jgi:hypothetical protein